MTKWLRAFWKFLRSDVPIDWGNEPVKKTSEGSSALKVQESKQEVVVKPSEESAYKEAPEPQTPIQEQQVEKKVIIQPSKEPLHVQIGLDFGTNCTKVCYSAGNFKKITPFRHRHNLTTYPDYTIPSIIAFDDKKNILFGGAAVSYIENDRWGLGIKNLKTLVASKSSDSFKDEISEQLYQEYMASKNLNVEIYTPDLLTGMYLSYLMRRISQNIKRIYSTENIDINFNICMPIDYVQKNAVKERFERVFAVAELIYREWQDADSDFNLLDTALKADKNAVYDENHPKTRVFAVPEAVAEMNAYLRSYQKKEGLHAIIDFGAGTTDVSLFNLIRFSSNPDSDAERSYWYSATAIPQGTFKIEKIVADYLKIATGESVKFKDVSAMLHNLRAKEDNDLAIRIRDESKKLVSSKIYRRTWTEAFVHLKKESLWHDVQIYVSGGGSQLPYFADFLSEPWHPHIAREKIRYPVEILTKPDDFDVSEDIPFYRMAVAYGLTCPKPMLQKYTLPKDAPDHTPPPLPTKAIADKDELYPK